MNFSHFWRAKTLVILLYLAAKVAQESGLSKGARMHSSTEDFFYVLLEEGWKLITLPKTT